MATMAINDIVTTIGIYLGKNIFHIVGMNARGAIVLKERLSRAKLAWRLTNMTSCLIGMEACAGAHHVGRQLAALGHDVRLIPAKYVRPLVATSQVACATNGRIGLAFSWRWSALRSQVG